MPKLPDPDNREIIARMPFVDEMVGELVAHLWHGTPQIDLEVKPFETDMYAKVGFNLREARQAAAELLQLVNVAQRAMWTPELLADVREHYLPGATDAEIIARLTRLAERETGLELRTSGRLFRHDGEELMAAAHREKVDRVEAAMREAQVSVAEMLSVVGDLRAIYGEPEDQG